MSHKTIESFLNSTKLFKSNLENNFFPLEEKINEDGLVASILLSNNLIELEFLCGPPEYHCELFISLKDSEKYSFADLIKDKDIKKWIEENPLHFSNSEKIIDEVKWHQKFIINCISKSNRFRKHFQK